MQEAICKTAEWSLRLGFQFSVDKTKTMYWQSRKTKTIQARESETGSVSWFAVG